MLVPGGLAPFVCDWRRYPDLAYLATTSGLRISTVLAWTRSRPGTGGLFRGSWDPVCVLSKGTPVVVSKAAIRNVVEVDAPLRRRHPYEKPAELWGHILQRIPPGLVLDPFCGACASRTAAHRHGHGWRGYDCDPLWAPPEDNDEVIVA